MADTEPKSPYELAQEAIAKGVSQQEFEKQLIELRLRGIADIKTVYIEENRTLRLGPFEFTNKF